MYSTVCTTMLGNTIMVVYYQDSQVSCQTKMKSKYTQKVALSHLSDSTFQGEHGISGPIPTFPLQDNSHIFIVCLFFFLCVFIPDTFCLQELALYPTPYVFLNQKKETRTLQRPSSSIQYCCCGRHQRIISPQNFPSFFVPPKRHD